MVWLEPALSGRGSVPARLFRLSENSGVPEYFGGGAARVALGGALSKVKKDGFFEGAAGPGGGAVGKSNLKNDAFGDGAVAPEVPAAFACAAFGGDLLGDAGGGFGAAVVSVVRA